MRSVRTEGTSWNAGPCRCWCWCRRCHRHKRRAGCRGSTTLDQPTQDSEFVKLSWSKPNVHMLQPSLGLPRPIGLNHAFWFEICYSCLERSLQTKYCRCRHLRTTLALDRTKLSWKLWAKALIQRAGYLLNMTRLTLTFGN